ncbi:MAG TPA: PQQ-binding-like beta-propeller repeat protein, partial [Kofleriaceae bacterium]|nr:PQQ-binding-like beta-propeller repeat protein [Kofleriaceae bacterium]
LVRARVVDRRCSSAGSRARVDDLRARLWIDEATVARWRRPAAPADADQARRLYRSGWDLRLAGRLDDARRALQRSLQLAPHPLTLVQLGLVDGAAGHAVDQRVDYARALALAEATRGVTAQPRFALGHSQAVLAVVHHPDGRTLVSSGKDGAVKMWDLATGRVTRSIAAHVESGEITPWVESLAVSPDGAHLASAGPRSVALWSAATGEELRRPPLDRARVGFTSDGTGLVVAAGELAVIDAASGATRWRVPLSTPASALATGTRMLVVATGRSLARFDPATGERNELPSQPGPVEALAISPAGDALAVGVLERAGPLAVHELPGGRLRWQVTTGRAVRSLAWAPDGSLLAVGMDGAVELREPAAGARTRGGAVAGEAAGLDFSPDGETLAIAADDITLIGMSDGKVRRHLAAHGEQVQYLAATDGGEVLAWAQNGNDTRVRRLVDARLATVPAELRAVSGDGSMMVALERPVDAPGWVTVLRAGQAPIRFPAGGRPQDVGFVPGADALVVLLGDAADRRTLTGERTWRTPTGELSGLLRFSADGARFAAGFATAERVWDTATGAQLAETTGQDKDFMVSLAWSPAGDRLARGTVGKRLVVSDAASGRMLYSRDDQGEDVEAVVYNPAGDLLASAGSDGRILLRDVADGRPLHTLTGHTGWFRDRALAFTRSGRVLVSAASDRTVRLWDGHSGAPLATIVGALEEPMLVIGEDGTVDGTAGADGLLYWEVGNVQLPGFVGWQRQRRPGLLGELLH